MQDGRSGEKREDGRLENRNFGKGVFLEDCPERIINRTKALACCGFSIHSALREHDQCATHCQMLCSGDLLHQPECTLRPRQTSTWLAGRQPDLCRSAPAATTCKRCAIPTPFRWTADGRRDCQTRSACTLIISERRYADDATTRFVKRGTAYNGRKPTLSLHSPHR
jgi:hypothetical protein